MLHAFGLLCVFALPGEGAAAWADWLVAEQHVPAVVVGTLDAKDRGDAADDVRAVVGRGRLAADDDRVPDGRTSFEIGSVTKVFTGVLLAVAAERAEIDPDAPLAPVLAAHLPADALILEEGELRWRHLANHTSGLPRMPGNFAPRDLSDPYADYGANRLFEFLSVVDLRAKPGTKYEYSNLGAGLLGTLLVEQAGAADYEALLRDRVCAPLRLDDTRIVLDEAARARLAPPHDGDLEPTAPWHLDALAGAGAIRSTAGNLLDFAAAALAAEGPLRAALERSMTATHVIDERLSIGLGWHLERDGALAWHNGQTGGYHSFLAIDRERGHAVVVLANAATGEVDRAARGVLAQLSGEDAPPPPATPRVEVPAATLSAYAGRYRLTPMHVFTIAADERGLTAQLTGQPVVRVYPESAVRFRYRVVDAALTFELDAEGKPVALVLHQHGQDQRAPRMTGEAP